MISVTGSYGMPWGDARARTAKRTALLVAFAVTMIPAAMLSGCATVPSAAPAETAAALLEAVAAGDADTIKNLVTMDEGDAARLESALELFETSAEPISTFDVYENTPWANVDGRTVSTVAFGFDAAGRMHEGTLDVVLTDEGSTRTPLVALSSLLGEIEVDVEQSSAASPPVGLTPVVDGIDGRGVHPALPGLYTASSPYPLFDVWPGEQIVVSPGARTLVYLTESAGIEETVAGTLEAMSTAVDEYLADCAYTDAAEACGQKASTGKTAHLEFSWEPGEHSPVADPVLAQVTPDGGLEVSAYHSVALTSTAYDASRWHRHTDDEPTVIQHRFNVRVSVMISPTGEVTEVTVAPTG